MNARKTLLALCMAAGSAAILAPAIASADIYVRVAPPPPRYEVVPADCGLISITACYFGLGTTGGTEGVGQSTTRTVVTSSILILIVDYFVTQVLLSVLSYVT